jgi:NADH-quinone oxidoreductase subunit K
MMDLRLFLTIGAVLFATGLYGTLTRRNAIGLLLSLELMANAVNINLVAFACFKAGAQAQAFTLFAIALTVAEVVVGLAIVVGLYRTHRDVMVELASELEG